jgi:hypothetical protein
MGGGSVAGVLVGIAPAGAQGADDSAPPNAFPGKRIARIAEPILDR